MNNPADHRKLLDHFSDVHVLYVHVYIKQCDYVIRLQLPNDIIIKPGPSSEYIFKQCTLHVCSGLLMWTFFFYFILVIFFLKKEGEESHARMSGMHVRIFHMYPQLAYAS